MLQKARDDRCGDRSVVEREVETAREEFFAKERALLLAQEKLFHVESQEQLALDAERKRIQKSRVEAEALKNNNPLRYMD